MHIDPDPPKNPMFGYTFIGQYVSLCAEIEDWMISILSQTLKDQKIPYTFGTKVRAVEELANAENTPFAEPKRINSLINDLTKHAKKRANLAHSIVIPATNRACTYWLFRNVGTSEQYWISQDTMIAELTYLKKLAKEVCDQQLKKPTPASSQPRPSRAATSGP